MSTWTEVLDHGDDPGRYTIIHGNGKVMTCHESGRVIFQRKCHNPHKLVHELRREPGVGILSPKHLPGLLKKINLLLLPDNDD